MKKLILCSLLLAINANIVYACGPWYPFGDGLRFSLINSFDFDDAEMFPFYYSSSRYNSSSDNFESTDLNVELWYEYCDGIVQKTSISKTLYELSLSEFSEYSNSEMLTYLNSVGKKNAIRYIEFAKSCSSYNSSDFDPWERGSDFLDRTRAKKIKKALRLGEKEKDLSIQKRYYFLALRLSYYHNDIARMRRLFDNHFDITVENSTILDYWSAYFVAISDDNSSKRNYKLAQLFEKCPSKRVPIQQYFDQKISISETLIHANSKNEKANIYLMYALRKLNFALPEIKQIQELNPNSRFIPFLLIREINKFEDWVLTPRYNKFPPSLSTNYFGEDYEQLMIQRINEDKERALEFADWLGTVKFMNNTDLLQAMQSYFYFIGGEITVAKSIADNISAVNEYISILVSEIQLLCIVRQDVVDDVDLLQQNQSLIMKDGEEIHNFIFALAREFENKNNMTLAATLFSHINRIDSYNSGTISWKGQRNIKPRNYWGFYTGYFSYLDDQYNTEEIVNLVSKIESHSAKENWIFRYVQQDLGVLLDLLGTKYLRIDSLEKAQIIFKRVPDSIWVSREYIQYLDANPFYTDLYTEHKKSKGDTIVYSKMEILDKLIQLKKVADNGSGQRAVKASYLVANCYLNMSYYGNSWMMQNFWWTANSYYNSSNKDDYFINSRAKAYYLKAYNMSENDKVKALCLRMAGRCEKYRLYQTYENDWSTYEEYRNGYEGYIFKTNKYYSQLKEEFPKDYEPLISNCESFTEYFELL
ncbi:MAG: hypothetical protein COA33_010690 [Fluviicola sp.]|nr:hypothetical protein [Fluviicola sp.]